ncbi:hypothetical protein F0U60_31530 [Archangium minus]|uniref:DUF3592 domain-containing protein n=1 Tax=Archangium minus TaxID=83450 RepID=A0ABY9WYF1_9BACT|nr:hypothetical protein F0U61_31605 [Archangium violaceum]WNG48163.1 hypothetical protein F0U60_31530 [Archangium minus]
MTPPDIQSRFWTTVVIAVPCLAFGGFEFMTTLRFVLYAEASHGVVVSASQRGDGQYTMFKGYPEVITFSDSDGNEHTTTLYYGQPGHHPPGSSVKILYNRYDPARTARYGFAAQLWLIPGAFLFIGAFGLTGAFVIRNRGY